MPRREAAWLIGGSEPHGRLVTQGTAVLRNVTDGLVPRHSTLDTTATTNNIGRLSIAKQPLRTLFLTTRVPGDGRQQILCYDTALPWGLPRWALFSLSRSSRCLA